MSDWPPEPAAGIAIVGLAARFPDARNYREFWKNLCEGRESVTRSTDQELKIRGIETKSTRSSPVSARGILFEADRFDAAFFGYSPKEAEIMDPQQRVFLESAWEALEDAGYEPEQMPGAVGVFAGVGINTYYAYQLQKRPDVLDAFGVLPALLLNEKDFIATRISYKLDLRGPAMTVQTACSTSLVAVCHACESLLNFDCDFALAGGAHIVFPPTHSFIHGDGGMISKDGHCRPFDKNANGTLFSDGVGVVALRRLEDALRDGDHVLAVIKGYAVNNDGADKAGFTAPSVNGQAEVIQMAHAFDGTPPESISYIEAHGTATPLGDPIEIAALTKAFRRGTQAKAFCAIGSVKSNIGHLDVAAGVAGLIKTALCLRHKKIPATLHYTEPNPKIDFANSPFYVVDRLTEWTNAGGPLRAGVSSFGIGGTNAHVVVEEAPRQHRSVDVAREFQLVTLSARSESALEASCDRLGQCLRSNPELNLADTAFTLNAGRRRFVHRAFAVVRDDRDTIEVLESRDTERVERRRVEAGRAGVAFMFPGQGAQRVQMGGELYQTEPVFRQVVDECSESLTLALGVDLRGILYPDAADSDAASERLRQTEVTQPALFVTELALARLWMSWGVNPSAIIGHSVGEYVAACLAGVFSVEDGLKLIAARGRLIQQQPTGSMLAVCRPSEEVAPFVTGSISLAAENSPSLCVVSGPTPDIERLGAELKRNGVMTRVLQTSHAFHSSMMEPVMAPFVELFQSITLNCPRLPWSNVTGDWINDSEAVEPEYWARHLRSAVRFSSGIATLLKDEGNLLLEVGPGVTLSTLAKQDPAFGPKRFSIASLPIDTAGRPESYSMIRALGMLWQGGAEIDWSGFYANQERHRVALPTYPFERESYWVDADIGAIGGPSRGSDAAEPVDTSTNPDGELIPGTARFVDRVTDIVHTLSGIDKSSLDSSSTFLQLGFDSLFLSQVCRAIDREFDVAITFPQLAGQLTTIDAVAEHLSDECRPAEPSTAPTRVRETAPDAQSTRQTLEGIQVQLAALTQKLDVIADAVLNDSTRDRVGIEEGNAPTPARIAVSDDQREIWLASQLSSDAAATYHESYVVQIEGVLDQALLASAIQEVVNRHDALRITFASDGSTQVIASRREQVLDVEELDARASEEDVEGRIRERILEPFDFETGPLFRSILFTQGPERFLLLLVVHHIIADGWSLAVLLDEVSTVYTEAQAGVTSSLKPALQYRDYVSWLTHDETKAQETAARDYWLEAFRNPLSVVELPSDHPRPAVKTFAAGHRWESLGEEFYAKVKRASQEYECTVFQLMLAGMMALLFRLTGQSDVVVGIPHAGQLSSGLGDLEGTDSLVGHCASLLPICARPRGEQTFGDLVREVKERLLEARNHQQFTYSKVSEQLKMSRDSSRVPLVSVSLNLVRVHHAKLGDLATQVTVPPKAFNFFDVTIDLLQGDRDLSLDAKYNSDLYEHSSVVRWLSQWRRVLEQALESSDQPLSQLTLLTERERGLMLEEWNATEREYLRDGVLHSLFERTADRDPSGTALVFGERSLTYLELEQRANRIAHQLREMGARPGRLVGVCLERSPDMVATLLAVLKSGAAYVPLDPAYPPDRIAYVLDNADATILVTQATVISSLEKIPCQVLSLDDDAESIEGQPVSRPDPLAGPEELAYVIYTSGSTGRPKGVQIEHRAAVNFVQAMAERPGLGRDDVLLAVTTVSFDIAVLELFLPMYAGATVVLASRVTAHDPEALQHALRQHGVTVMQATPATWSMLIETGWTGSPGLRVLCGGEALSADLAEQLLPRCAELWNMCGPTETTVWSSCCKIEEPANIHIGTPIANTQLYILDDALQPRPIGAAGELMIGGDGVARGYLGQPTLTAQKFIASPFREGQPIYRTGDLAKFRDDGSIECLGRVDFQVKIRGLRVELGEIESVLTAQAGIEQAVAVAREDRPGDKRLVAYVRTAEGAPFGETELRQAVKATLPDYMVPTRVVALDAFPLTPNGKVDRQASPKPQNAAPQKNGEDERPRGEIEVGLERLLKTILQLPSVGRHDNFFDAGGHSLLAVKYFNEIHRAYGIRLPLSTLLRAGSIAELAAEIGNRRQSNHGPRSLVEIQSEGTKPTFFCVHGAGGNVLFYRDLSRTLGAEFPFYGLQSRGSDGSSEPLSSIEEMAKTYVKEVKTVQASGPYHLGGYCLGGLIAYEMARQLEDSDDEVALLALLDSYNLSRMEPVGTPRNLTEKAYFHLRNLLHAPYSTWRSYMAQKIRTARDGELSLIANSIFRRRRATEDSLQGRIHRLNVAAAMRYQPRPYRGVVTNLKPTRNYSAFPDPDMGWSGLALEGVTNINLDLNPHAMLAEPFVAQTAAALSRLLSTPERRLRVVDRRSA